jgi:flavodoxin
MYWHFIGKYVNMSSLVIYFSKFGNTKLVAETIGEVLKGAGGVRIKNSDELAVADFDGVDLVVMGSPTHKMNLPEAVRPLFDKLPRQLLKGKLFAAFDTSYKMSWWLNQFTASKRLSPKLRKLGGKGIIPPQIFHVMEREGPLYDGELEHAKEWATLVLDKSNILSNF